MAKTFSIAVAALLICGFFALSHTAAAHDISSDAYPRADYAGGGLYPGSFDDVQVSRNNTDYYLTSSPFCPPNGSNAYNGGFATLAYGVNGRPAGYVCR